MKDHSKNFKELLETNSVKTRINGIRTKTNKDLTTTLNISNEDIKKLRKIINKSKNHKGIPEGTIEFNGNIIPISLILDNISWLKDAYFDADIDAYRRRGDPVKKNKILERANDKLISTIFILLDEENLKSKKEADAKSKSKERKAKEKARHSLDHKLLYQNDHPGRSIELTDKYEIIERISTIDVGDRITFKDGYSIVITEKKLGKVKIRFEGTPSLSADGFKGEGWWNLNELLQIPGTTVDDIRQLNIPSKSGRTAKKQPNKSKPDDPKKPEVLPPNIPDDPKKPEVLPPDVPDDPKKPEVLPPDVPDDPKKPEVLPPNIPDDPKKPEVLPPNIPDDPKKPEVLPPQEDSELAFEADAVLSDVSQSYEDLISREVDNEINEDWHNTSRYNLLKRGKLFLMRGRIRKKKIEEMKKNYENTPFTGNSVIDSEMSTQAARHDLEQILQGSGVTRKAFGKIEREKLIDEDEVKFEGRFGKEFKEMCQDYVANNISQNEFQDKFNIFVRDKLGYPKKQHQFVASNILEKLDAIKNDNALLTSITTDLEKYLIDKNLSHFDAINKKIDNDFKKYRRDPRFRKEIMDILGSASNLSEDELKEKINKFIGHQKALVKASMKNLQIKLDLLSNGKGAYQIRNKDRENWLFKLGDKLDKMPRWGQALTVAGISATGMLVGGAVAATGATAFASGLAGTATLSGLVGAKNFIKKWTHHTREQNTYEKNLTRNYEEEIAKMKEWERIRTEKDSEGKYTNSWFKRYRAKRQLELYGKTTQSELQDENKGNTRELSDFIYTALDRYDSLEDDEKNVLNYTLLDAKARLETYWNMGHNFLKSRDKNQIERDFYDLEVALNLGANRILGSGATLKDISKIKALDEDKKLVNYTDLLNSYKNNYNSATKKFRGERILLATKWGFSTAAITFGTSFAMQAATGTGMFAKDAVNGTLGTPESTSTTNTGNITDHYGMGQREGGDNVLHMAQGNITKDTSAVTLHFGAGTDGTPVRAGSVLLNPKTYTNKLEHVKALIGSSSIHNKADLISQLDHGFATSGFTNTNLHGMRCLEVIEETVKGATENGFSGTLNLSYDPIMNIDGTIAHDAASRVSNAVLEITNVIPGQPGTTAVEAGNKWLVVGLPWFSNTFKRKNSGKPKDKGPNDKSPNDKGPNDKSPNDKGLDDTPSKKEGNDKGKSGGDSLDKTGGNDEGETGIVPIVVPPLESDEKDEIDDKDTKEATETTDKEEEVSLKKMNDEDLENFNKSDFTDRAKDYTKDFKPENILKLPGGEIIYLTNYTELGSRKKIVGYSRNTDGKIDIRLLYRSNSEGCWRSAPGMDGRRYSKGETLPNGSYETTTKVDFRIGEILDKIPESKDSKLEWTDKENSEILLDEMKRQVKIDTKMFPKEENDAVRFYQGKNSEDVIEGYKKLIPEGLEYKDMKKVASKKYSYKHEYLGKVNVEIYTMKYNGRDVDIYFSRSEKDSPNKVRIENIVYSDAKINSFGLYNEQINGGPLVAKPIDYRRQTPKNRNGKPYGYAGFLSEEEAREYATYLDIRDLYQGNPIIKKYKELAKIKESE